MYKVVQCGRRNLQANSLIFYLCIGTNKPMIDAIAPRVNIVVENNLYWKLEQLIQQKTKYEIV